MEDTSNDLGNEIVRELLAAGPTVPLWPLAGQAVGASRTNTYRMAKTGTFPAKVLRLGTSYRVVTADLKALLGLAETQALANSA